MFISSVVPKEAILNARSITSVSRLSETAEFSAAADLLQKPAGKRKAAPKAEIKPRSDSPIIYFSVLKKRKLR